MINFYKKKVVYKIVIIIKVINLKMFKELSWNIFKQPGVELKQRKS